MALIKLGAFITALSGKIGGQSISNRAQQTTIRNIVHTNKTATPKQSVQRFQTAHISNRFIFLSAGQKSLWNATAVNYEYVNRIGDTVTRNGFGTFSFLNQNLYLIGEPIKNSPPLYAAAVNPTIVIDNYGLSALDISAADADADYTYALFAAANMSSGASAQNGIMRFCGIISAADLLAGINIIPQIENVFDVLAFPNNIGFRIDAINTSTGNRAPDAQLFTVQVVSTPIIVYDADYQAILDYSVLNGISTPTALQQDLQNQLMIDIKAAVPLSAFDMFYVLANDAGQPFGWINWSDPSIYSFNGSWNFFTNAGMAPNAGGGTPIMSGYFPNVDAVAYTLNDASIGFKRGIGSTDFAANDSVFRCQITGASLTQQAGLANSVRINMNANTSLATVATAGDFRDESAYSLVNRTSGSSIELMRNGIKYTAVSSTATALPAFEMAIGFSAATFNARFVVLHIGRAMTLVEHQALNTAFDNYIAAL